MRAIEAVAYMLAAAFPTIALITPHFPPFFSYFFCRLAQNLLSNDLCGIEAEFFHIPDIRANFTVNVFRITGALITLITYATVFWSAVLVVLFEAFPSLLSQRVSLRQFRSRAGHCAFSEHTPLVLKYRQLQVLNTMFNNIYSRDLFTICMASFLLYVIPTGYFILTIHKTNMLASVVATCVTLTQYAVILGIFSMAGQVWSESVELRRAWQTNDQLASKKLTRRYAKSLPDIKVKIGCTNFVDKFTPLVFLSFCVEQTVNLVHMQK
jgi:hypothetical protein